MNTEYFDKFINYEHNGVKTRPKMFLNKFILSFENYKEKELWTIEYLPVIEKLFYDDIPNELFEEVIFPVLYKDYENNVELKKYIIKFGKSCSRNEKIWRSLGWELRYEIIEKLYELEPNNNEVIDVYLMLKIDDIKFRLHHPPHIILYGLEDCKELLNEIPFIKNLDRNKIYHEYISEFENKLKKQMEKLE